MKVTRSTAQKISRHTYHVTTALRTYNAIESQEHLETVRQNWGDNEPIFRVFVWAGAKGWQKIRPCDMVETTVYRS